MWEKLGEEGVCQRCDKRIVQKTKNFGSEVNKEALETHHLIPKSKEENKVQANLAYICANCHKKIHSNWKGNDPNTWYLKLPGRLERTAMDIREPVFYDYLNVSLILEKRKETFLKEYFLLLKKSLLFWEIFWEKRNEIFQTGEKPSFKVKIKNLTDSRKKGVIILIWHLGPNATPYPIAFNIPARETKEYYLQKEWLCQPGIATYRFPLIAGEGYKSWKPEELLKKLEGFKGNEIKEGVLDFIPPQIATKALNSSFHTLCQYKVEDRATFERERNRIIVETVLTFFIIVLTIYVLVTTIVGIVISIPHKPA